MAVLVSTASCSDKASDESKPRRDHRTTTPTDARSSHNHAKSWTVRNLLDITIPLLGASILDLHAKYGAKLRKKASGHALELPPIGRRRRHSYALLEVDDTSKRVRELVVMFPMATDSDQVRAEFVRRWGKPKRSREHKCMLRGCVYGTTPKVVIKEIDTRLMWSIRVMSK